VVKDLSKIFSLKRDTSLRYGEHDRDLSYESDTDEKIVAMAYYSSLYEGFPVSIIASDSDIAGIRVNAIETDDDSGVFEAAITFSQSSTSSGSRLLAIPGDKLYVKYEDRTLPKPYSISDELGITAESLFESNIPAMKRTVIKKPLVADSAGRVIDKPQANNQLQIVSEILNTQNFGQNFVYLMQITNEKGTVLSLSWIQGMFDANQELELSQSWLPTEAGEYKVETFVWKSLQNPVPISPSISQTFLVQ